jgi:hypothetical protein
LTGSRKYFAKSMIIARRFFPLWEASQLGSPRRGPECGLDESEIMTILVLYHRSNFKHFKNFYNGVVRIWLHGAFPKAPSYQRFIELKPRVMAPLMMFFVSKLGRKTGIYYIDSTPLPVCHNLRINRHKVFAGLAARGKTSTGWFFGFKLHPIFNHQHEIVACKLTPGNVSDSAPVPAMARDLVGKLFGDKGYSGKKLAETLLRHGLALMTRVRKNMRSLPMTFADKALLNSRNIAETIIGNIKEFSSLNIPKHRSSANAFLHIIAALTAYQLNPIKLKSTHLSLH